MVSDDLPQRFQGTVFVCVQGGLTKTIPKATVFVCVCPINFQIPPHPYLSFILHLSSPLKPLLLCLFFFLLHTPPRLPPSPSPPHRWASSPYSPPNSPPLRHVNVVELATVTLSALPLRNPCTPRRRNPCAPRCRKPCTSPPPRACPRPVTARGWLDGRTTTARAHLRHRTRTLLAPSPHTHASGAVSTRCRLSTLVAAL